VTFIIGVRKVSHKGSQQFDKAQRDNNAYVEGFQFGSTYGFGWEFSYHQGTLFIFVFLIN
jgi:hypothetical protein